MTENRFEEFSGDGDRAREMVDSAHRAAGALLALPVAELPPLVSLQVGKALSSDNVEMRVQIGSANDVPEADHVEAWCEAFGDCTVQVEVQATYLSVNVTATLRDVPVVLWWLLRGAGRTPFLDSLGIGDELRHRAVVDVDELLAALRTVAGSVVTA